MPHSMKTLRLCYAVLLTPLNFPLTYVLFYRLHRQRWAKESCFPPAKQRTTFEKIDSLKGYKRPALPSFHFIERLEVLEEGYQIY